MSFATNVTNLATRIATEFKAIRTLITGSGTGDLTGLTTTDKTSVVAAINELDAAVDAAASSGGATNLDQLTDVTLTSPTQGQTLIRDGAGQFVNSDLPAGSETTAGILELNTTAETATGTDTTRASHAAGVKAAIDQRIDSATDLGGASPSATNAPSQSAVKAYADALIAANDAMVFKGVIDASTDPNYPAADAGHNYRISVAGHIGGASGPAVEVGDLLMCLTDGTAAGDHATVGASWNITQVNVDGAVTGPASSTDGNLATFNGTTGKSIEDSGISVDSDGTMAANSASRIPTQSAVRAYTYSKTDIGDPTTDFVATFEAGLL